MCELYAASHIQPLLAINRHPGFLAVNEIADEDCSAVLRHNFSCFMRANYCVLSAPSQSEFPLAMASSCIAAPT